MKSSRNWSIAIFGWLCIAGRLLAQLPEFNEAEVLRFAGTAKAVMLQRSEVVRIQFEKNKPRITLEHTAHILYLTETTLAGQEYEIPYSEKFFPLKEIAACTYVKTDKGYTKIKAQPAKHTSRIASGLFYDDMKQASVSFPSIEKYSISELHYVYEVLDPMYVFPFYFNPSDQFPLIRSSCRLEYDAGFDIRIAMFGDTTGVRTQSGMKGRTAFVEKSLERQAGKKSFENTPEDAYYKGHMVYFIRSYQDKSGKRDFLGTVDQLYQRNYSYIKDFNNEPCSKDLKTVADSIRNNSPANDSLQLIENVLYWIQDHIRYVAIEDGLSGYVPRASNSVFEKRYGDCKDMAALMQYMLKECGIVSHLTWIGTRDIPYTFEQMPLMRNCNHMILAKKINGIWRYYDPTAEGLSSNLPSSFIQGKEAMIALDSAHYEIGRVPEVPGEVNFQNETAKGKLNSNGSLELSGTLRFGGFSRWRIASMYESMDEKNRKDFVESIVKHEYDNAKVLNYTVLNLKDRNRPLEIEYTAEFPDFAKVIDQKVYLNPHLSRSMMHEKIKEERENIPVEYLFKYHNTVDLSIEFPENLRSAELPESVNYSSGMMDFHRNLSTDKNTLNLHSSIQLKAFFFEAPQFEEWNRGVSKINRSFRESIVLSPKP